jgi:hypothetical protein
MTEGLPDNNLPAEIQNALGEVAGWKVRAAKLLMKVLGSAAAKEALFSIGDDLNTLRGRSIVSDAMARKVAETVTADSSLIERAALRFWNDEAIKQVNLEATAKLAAQEILLLPPPLTATGETAEGPADVASDWCRRWTQFVGEISDEDVQRIWARMLAGEFREPGSFSFLTMRLLSEMDAEDATIFSEVASKRVNSICIFTPGDRSRDAEYFNKVSRIESLGLTYDRTNQVFQPLGKIDELTHFFRGTNHIGVVFTRSSRQLGFPAIRFTRAGTQLLQLLEPIDEVARIREALLHVKGTLDGDSAAVIQVLGPHGTESEEYIWGNPDIVRDLKGA